MVDIDTMKQRVYGLLMETCGCSCMEALKIIGEVKVMVECRQDHLKQKGVGGGVDWIDTTEKKYRKRPVVISAIKMDKEFTVTTMEGEMRGKVGDYLVTGIKGEQYPCDASIFEQTYDLVEN